MAFYRKLQMAIDSKWYPKSVLVGSPITTDQIAKHLSRESTVAPADVKAVLTGLADTMGFYMAQGRSVKLDGIGTFFFQSNASGNGVDSPEEVSPKQIHGVKIRFIPETKYQPSGGSRRAIRPMSEMSIEWIDIESLKGNDDETGIL